jgi:hypothetical protein
MLQEKANGAAVAQIGNEDSEATARKAAQAKEEWWDALYLSITVGTVFFMLAGSMVSLSLTVLANNRM